MKKNAPESKPEYPKGPVPKAIKVENAANYLMITFDNGETRYLRSHYLDDYLDAYSLKKDEEKDGSLSVVGQQRCGLALKLRSQMMVQSFYSAKTVILLKNCGMKAGLEPSIYQNKEKRASHFEALSYCLYNH